METNNISLTNPVLLFAPLDWGLGHTTRCIPLIRYLLSIDCHIIAAVNAQQRIILEQEFSSLRFVSLNGYRLAYGKNGWRTITKIIVQIPKIIAAVRYENTWLQAFVRSNHVDAVISDNRYGLFTRQIPCIFITHQLTIRTPFGKIIERLLQSSTYRFINKFSACWVPDYEENENLAGKLSHPVRLPGVPLTYIGRISRISSQLPRGVPGTLLILLSGPEPQRSIFETTIVRELNNFKQAAVLVRGLPQGGSVLPISNEKVIVHDYLSSAEIEVQITQAEIIVSRSGYSTVMDIIGRGKKCIFVPTPGQTEQVYLAAYLQQQRLCIRFHQYGFSLEAAVRQANEFHFATPSGLSSEIYQTVLDNFIHRLKSLAANRPDPQTARPV